MRIGILYHGLIRGFKYQNVFDSHKKFIWDEIRNQGHSFSCFVSTYNKEFDDIIYKIENLESVIIKDDLVIQSELTDIAKTFICPSNFSDDLKMNILKSWKSQEYLSQYISTSKFDLLILLPIAQLINTPLDTLDNLDTDTYYTPNFAEHTGLNDRFLICNNSNMLFILNKLNYILNQSPRMILCSSYILNTFGSCNLHPESAYKILLESNGYKHSHLTRIKFWRCRSDGSLIKDC